MLGPAKYSTSIPTVAPTTVFRIRERNAFQAACSSGSVMVITEINADKGLCSRVWCKMYHTRLQPAESNGD
jgi:hypothetical protein